LEKSKILWLEGEEIRKKEKEKNLKEEDISLT